MSTAPSTTGSTTAGTAPATAAERPRGNSGDAENKQPAAPPADKPYELVNEHDKALAATLSEADKANFIRVVQDIWELNGSGEEPGTPSSYIDAREFVQLVDDLKVSPKVAKAMFMALNWNALGRGNGGIAGASVRWALKEHFISTREVTIHRVIPNGIVKLMEEYEKAVAPVRAMANFFVTNAISVATLAGAMVNKIVHHWDAKHKAPQKAFISSMGMADLIPDDQYRAVFYLAVHPLPLAVTERFRSGVVAGSVSGVADVVAMRCRGPPAGYGIVNACAAAVAPLLAEKYMQVDNYVPPTAPTYPTDADMIEVYNRQFEKYTADAAKTMAQRRNVDSIRDALERIRQMNHELTMNAGHFHQFALKYGFPRREVADLKMHENAMIMLVAYIFSRIKGSLSESAAVGKFRDQHAREVAARINAFNRMGESEDPLAAIGI